MESFAMNLKKLMQERDIQQVDLSRLTHFSTSKISKLLGGNKDPKLSDLIIISKALKVSIMDLLKNI